MDDHEVESTGEVTSKVGQKMALSSAIITVLLFFSKIAGYAKEFLVSRWFSQEATDGFKVVYSSLFNLIYTRTEELLRPTYFPIFVRRKLVDGEKKAWDLTNVVVTVELGFLVVAGLVCFIFARSIVTLGWPQMAQQEESLRIAVQSLRIMAPALVLFCLSLMTELTSHAYKRFTIPALSEMAFRFSVCFIMVGLVTTIWPQKSLMAPLSLAVSVAIGGSLRFLVMVPGLARELRHYRPSFKLTNPDFLAMLKLMPWVVVGVIFSITRTYADTRVGTDIGVGAYSCLDWARRLIDMPVQILAIAVSFVVYPYLSEWASTRDKDKMIQALAVTTRAIGFIYIPTAVGMIILSLPLAWLAYGGGEFKMEDAILTGKAIDVYAIGMPFFAMESVIMKWFFALQDTATPNLVGASMAIFHVAIAVLGVRVFSGQTAKMGMVALALTASKAGKILLLYIFLKRRLGRISDRMTVPFFGKLFISLAIMVVAMLASRAGLQNGLDLNIESKKHALLLLSCSAASGGVSFVVTAFLLRIEELRIVTGELFKKANKLIQRGRG